METRRCIAAEEDRDGIERKRRMMKKQNTHEKRKMGVGCVSCSQEMVSDAVLSCVVSFSANLNLPHVLKSRRSLAKEMHNTLKNNVASTERNPLKAISLVRPGSRMQLCITIVETPSKPRDG